jgi:hypothetical protein
MNYPTEYTEKKQREQESKGEMFFSFVNPDFVKPGISGKGCILNYTTEIYPDNWREIVEKTAYWEPGHDAVIILTLTQDWGNYKAGTIIVTDLYPHNGGWIAISEDMKNSMTVEKALDVIITENRKPYNFTYSITKNISIIEYAELIIQKRQALTEKLTNVLLSIFHRKQHYVFPVMASTNGYNAVVLHVWMKNKKCYKYQSREFGDPIAWYLLRDDELPEYETTQEDIITLFKEYAESGVMSESDIENMKIQNL